MKTFFMRSAVALLFVVSAQVHAAAISADVLYGFAWEGVGVADEAFGEGFRDNAGLVVSDPGAAPWTFSGEGSFEVLDLLVLADRFTVYDNGALLGVSSVPGGGFCGNNLARCFADPNASYGSFLLGAGDHSITILATGFERGRGAFRFTPVSAVPLPATAWLFGSALFGLITAARRKSGWLRPGAA